MANIAPGSSSSAQRLSAARRTPVSGWTETMTSAPSSTQIRGDQSSSGHRTRLNSPLMSPERMPRLKPASRLLSCQISQAASRRPVVAAEREAVDAEALADRVDDDARVVDVDRHPQPERLDDPADLVRLAVPALVVRLVEGHPGRVDEAAIERRRRRAGRRG